MLSVKKNENEQDRNILPRRIIMNEYKKRERDSFIKPRNQRWVIE